MRTTLCNSSLVQHDDFIYDQKCVFPSVYTAVRYRFQSVRNEDTCSLLLLQDFFDIIQQREFSPRIQRRGLSQHISISERKYRFIKE